MPSYSVATSKDRLSALIDKAQAGEEVVITRRDKPAARLVAADEDIPAMKDARAATERLNEWRKAHAPRNLGIPLHNFNGWLYEDEED